MATVFDYPTAPCEGNCHECDGCDARVMETVANLKAYFNPPNFNAYRLAFDIKFLKDAKGLSQAKIAKMLGTSPSLVSQLLFFWNLSSMDLKMRANKENMSPYRAYQETKGEVDESAPSS